MFGSNWGAPSSRVVQSDEEFNNMWQQKLSNTPRFVSNDAFTDPGTQSVANNSMWNQLLGDFGGQNKDALQAMFDFATKAGVSVQANGNGTVSTGINPYTAAGAPIAASMGASHSVQGVENPAYNALAAEAQKAREARADAQKRQTAAYGQMQGGNYFGGFLNDEYGQMSPSDGYSASQSGASPMGLGQSTPQGWAGLGQPTTAGTLNAPKQMIAGRIGGLGGLGGFDPSNSWGGPFGGG